MSKSKREKRLNKSKPNIFIANKLLASKMSLTFEIYFCNKESAKVISEYPSNIQIVLFYKIWFGMKEADTIKHDKC